MGRKRIEIELPNRPFTTGDLAHQYPEVSTNVFHVRLRELVQRGELKIVGKRQRVTSGKAWFLYAKSLPYQSSANSERARMRSKHPRKDEVQ